ncbi:MAG: DUF1272 domain-containing protein [Microcoleus sp. PH2017_29_MFU_D_A]|jgi:uncharacterized protein|uniref:DUF1272 domain-containing protein n=1 Tax=unclassified Microcoleus TaxID=2642155 RepID=UPI001DF42F57|nr:MULTISPECIES: DUF1272 domain-containing protein [unclassified Microcoleus]MCC3465259.1 DUF1272 domain-containing protein [Microcoleus sp. PH2017_06_SFM_O_A]TAE13062.1 MAG: DUF1272 domain-containing protein [Oscillatoriales cyanobacterium]MCC3582801.1 DUF1272 domain-containing protein [Microcoleus sp. PH2017_30_WIL_O_A]MCC3589948.1 DUF1272 domain-containing protein [Microcoleus sp. PH2017_28_MFU_U_A]MCC3602859.1 DUF1272 domain-containing protein [Microcoleus sp. PH2017_29_MFU_D_A]
MLELRPTCEHCNKALPPDSLDARICTYECTFCATCVESILGKNICPNCGGGFVLRPIRPSKNWRDNNYLSNDPAIAKVKYRPVDLEAYAKLVAAIGSLAPEKR